MSFQEAIMWLIFAHFIGDWALQNRWMADNKGKYKEVMFAHCMIYTACCAMALRYVGIGEKVLMWSIWICISHYIIDYWKCWIEEGKGIVLKYLYWDHGAHFGILAGILFSEKNNFSLAL